MSVDNFHINRANLKFFTAINLEKCCTNSPVLKFIQKVYVVASDVLAFREFCRMREFSFPTHTPTSNQVPFFILASYFSRVRGSSLLKFFPHSFTFFRKCATLIRKRDDYYNYSAPGLWRWKCHFSRCSPFFNYMSDVISQSDFGTFN